MESDIIKKLPVWAQVVIITCVMLGFGGGFIWDKVDSSTERKESRAVLEEYIRQGDMLEKIVDRQENIDTLKKAINMAAQAAIDEFNNEFISVLGETLANNNVSFPNTLNKAIRDVREKFSEVKNRLIDTGVK